MNTLEALKSVLKEEIEGCRNLLELLQEEKRRLMGLELDGVESVIKAKDILILKLRLLEEERVRVVERWQAENGMDRSNPEKDLQQVTLKRLAEKGGDGELMDLRSKLVSLTQSIKEMNEFNRGMIDRTLDFIHKSHPIFSKINPGSPDLEKGRVYSRAT
jgi:flagellar biosynthesis/type III secretory pathway chaperone